MVQQSQELSEIYYYSRWEQLEVLENSITRFMMNCLEVTVKVICHATTDIQKL